MSLRLEFEKAGNWLFRWRSYLPLLMVGVFLLSLKEIEHTGFNKKLDEFWEISCFLISLVGFGIRIYTIGHVPKGTSGRNRNKQKAETLNTTGIYSLVRHPLYLGNFFIGLGISFLPRLWWLTVIYMLSFWIYYERIMFAEEAFLERKFGDEFLHWAARTPPFVPRFKNWIPPDLPFSLKNVLKREYNGFLVVIVGFTLYEVVGDILTEGRFEIDVMWATIFGFGLVVWCVLRTLKKKTKIFHVEGR